MGPSLGQSSKLNPKGEGVAQASLNFLKAGLLALGRQVRLHGPEAK